MKPEEAPIIENQWEMNLENDTETGTEQRLIDLFSL